MLRLARIGIAAAGLALLLLDFAALDDITTGNEPDFYLEYAILGVSLPLLGACVRRQTKLDTSMLVVRDTLKRMAA